MIVLLFIICSECVRADNTNNNYLEFSLIRKRIMFSKKIMPVAGIALISALLLTGCSTSSNGDNANTPAASPSPVTEGAAAATSFASIYEASLAKANKEGYVATTVGGEKTEYIYAPELSKTEVIAYSQEYGSRLPAEMTPGLNAFRGVSTGDLEQVSVNGAKDGSFTFAFKDNSNYKVTVTTANGLITGMLISIDGVTNSDVTITYGVSTAQAEAAKKWFAETKDQVVIDPSTIQEVGPAPAS